jgi:hypothetical protein
MAAPTTPTHWYVDPSIAGDSGTGTVGDPYGDLQYALNTLTPTTTGGDQINIKAGTAEVLAAALVLSTYGVPSLLRPLIFRGYTSAANDGGIGGINGNGFSLFGAGTWDLNTLFRDMDLDGNNSAVSLSSGNKNVNFHSCEIHNSTAGLGSGNTSIYINCYFHDCSSLRMFTSSGNFFGCGFFDVSGEKVTTGDMLYMPRSVLNCIFYRTETLPAMDLGASSFVHSPVAGNVFFADGGTIGIKSGGGSWGVNIFGNLFEGWSTAGIDATAFPTRYHRIFNNAFHNCTATIINVNSAVDTDNESLGSTPFAKSGAATWTNRKLYWEPVSGGNVIAGALIGPGHSKGAVQPASGAAGMLRRSSQRGGYQ